MSTYANNWIVFRKKTLVEGIFLMDCAPQQRLFILYFVHIHTKVIVTIASILQKLIYALILPVK